MEVIELMSSVFSLYILIMMQKDDWRHVVCATVWLLENIVISLAVWLFCHPAHVLVLKF